MINKLILTFNINIYYVVLYINFFIRKKMAELGSNKYNIAWFKLAEFVSRKEKERALGIYKLLVHSFQSEALAYKLKGDIYLSFNDLSNCIDNYLKAADIYQLNNQFVEVAALYEHLNLIVPNNIAYTIKIYKFYIKTQNTSKIKSSLHSLIQSIIFNKKLNDLDSLIYNEGFDINMKLVLYEYVIFYIIEKNHNFDNCFYKYIDSFIEIAYKNNKNILDKFCDKIMVLNLDIYDYLLTILLKLNEQKSEN